MLLTCDVCGSPPGEIVHQILDSYQVKLNFDHNSFPENLPNHLKSMVLQGLSPVVSCSSCGVEDEIAPIECFEKLAYIKAFQVLPGALSLQYLRESFGTSQTGLAERIGYETGQAIWRLENKKSQIPQYAINAAILSYLQTVQNNFDNFLIDLGEWCKNQIEMTPDNRIIVPLPEKRFIRPKNYTERNSNVPTI